MAAEWLRLLTPSANHSLSQQQLHSRYVLQLLLETWRLLRMLPNINRISTCHSKEVTICGETSRTRRSLPLTFTIKDRKFRQNWIKKTNIFN